MRKLAAVLMGASIVCACSAADVDGAATPIQVRPTQFSRPPAAIVDDIPSAAQLTELYNASTDYSIRVEDRQRMFDGSDDANVSIATAWGAQPTPRQVEFAAVESLDLDSVQATGDAYFGTLGPHPIGPVPFVRYAGEWRMSSRYVSGILDALRGPGR